jgi:hypothetical protein
VSLGALALLTAACGDKSSDCKDSLPPLGNASLFVSAKCGDGGHGVQMVSGDKLYVRGCAIIGNSGAGVMAQGVGQVAIVDPYYDEAGIVDPAFSPRPDGDLNGIIDPAFAPASIYCLQTPDGRWHCWGRIRNLNAVSSAYTIDATTPRPLIAEDGTDVFSLVNIGSRGSVCALTPAGEPYYAIAPSSSGFSVKYVLDGPREMDLPSEP